VGDAPVLLSHCTRSVTLYCAVVYIVHLVVYRCLKYTVVLKFESEQSCASVGHLASVGRPC
jgi:hypothetical protein